METVVPISTRLIANKASYEFKKSRIGDIVRALKEEVEA